MDLICWDFLLILVVFSPKKYYYNMIKGLHNMNDLRLNEIFKNKFFDGLQRDEFLNINTDQFVEKHFNPKELIIEQDTPGDVMYLIASGEVLITKVIGDSEIELAKRYKGDYIGEMALFDNQPRSANVKALTHLKLYEINNEQFFKLLNNIDQIKINIIKIINSTVRDTGERLGKSSVTHNKQITIKESELKRTRTLLEETIELKRYIDEQKGELELINKELKKKNRELYQLTIIDDLTHLYSCNHFETLLNSEYVRAEKYGLNFSFLILDIDDFTLFNENFGEFTGDRVLKEGAGLIGSFISPEDILGRTGGDSLSIILPHQSVTSAVELAKKLLMKCRESVLVLNGVKTTLSVTIGISDNKIGNPKSGNDVFENARKALKIGKNNGKDCFKVLEL